MKYSNTTHIKALDQFFGKHISDCSDRIDAIAREHNLNSLPLDLESHVGNIDIEDDRLNVGLLGGAVMTFSIG